MDRLDHAPMLFFDGRSARRAWPVLGEYIRPNVNPRKSNSPSGTFCVGSLVVNPYVLGYDACILSIAVAFLVSDGISRGFLPGERMAALICYTGLFLLLTPTAPAVPFISIILLLVIGRRVAAYERSQLPFFTTVAGCDEARMPTDSGATLGVNA
jgi:hypothetical protein